MTIVLREPTSQIITCKFCGAILQYDADDVQEIDTDKWKYTFDTYYIACPRCFHKVKL